MCRFSAYFNDKDTNTINTNTEFVKMCIILKTVDHRAKLLKDLASRARSASGEYVYVRYLLWLILSVWGHSVHFAKFPMLRFSQATSNPVVIQFQPNVMENMIIRGGGGGKKGFIFFKVFKFLKKKQKF